MSRLFRAIGVSLGLLIAAVPLAAQQGATITGRVISDAGTPIAFASVFLEGMGLGTTTREDGNYSFTVPGARATGQKAQLTARAIGYKTETQNITLSSGTITQNFTLTTNPLHLGEVVVTGAGTESSVERLGAVVSSVKSEEIAKSVEMNTVQALAAKAPGVLVTQTSGEPGAAAFIQIRGEKSIEGTSQPMFVVDGVPVDNSSINTTSDVGGTSSQSRMADLNPEDIASVEILKGAAAAAIYGARAGAGVILITTKRGRAGAPQWTFHSTYSADQTEGDYPLQRDYGQGNEGVASTCGGPDCRPASTSWGPKLAAGTPTYNHFTELFNTGNTYDNALSLSGGTDRATFYGSLGRTDQNGIIVGPNDAFNRTTSLIKGTLQLRDNLSIGATVNYANTSGAFVQKGSNISGLLLGGLRTPPDFNNLPYLDPTTGLQRSYRYPEPTPTSQYDSRGYDNPFFTIYKDQNTSDVGRSFGNFNIDYNPLSWLTFKYTLGADYSSDNRVEGLPPSNSTQPLGQIDRADYTIFQVDHNLIAQAEKSIGGWVNTSLTLGQNLNSRSYKQLQVRGTGFIAPNLFELSNTIPSNLLPLDYESLVHLESYFGEGKIDFWNQLYFTVGTRNDASSTFGKSVRHNWFPKASAAWEFSKFMHIQNGNGLFSYGKLRLAYGQTGREPDPYEVFSGYQVGTFGDGWTTGLSVSQAGNAGLFLSAAKGQENLKPERNGELEFGGDFAFFNSNLDLGVTYYSDKSTDVILSVPVPPSTGYYSQVANAAEITNKGTEITANWRALNLRDLTWNIGAQWSANHNLVTNLAGADQFFFASGFVSGIKQGYAHGIFLDYDFGRCRYKEANNVVNGVDINAACTAAHAPEGAMYIDDSGFPVLDPTQRVVGDPNPKWTGSVNTSIQLWRKLNLSGLVDIRHGGQVWNGTKGALYHYGTALGTDIRGQMRTFGTNFFPGPTVGPGAGTAVVIDQDSWFQNLGSGFVGPAIQFVEDGGFVKLRELSASYTLDQPWVRHSGFSTLDVRLSGRNLFLSTKYTGIDPETSLGGAVAARGNDYFNNPQARSFAITLNFNR